VKREKKEKVEPIKSKKLDVQKRTAFWKFCRNSVEILDMKNVG